MVKLTGAEMQAIGAEAAPMRTRTLLARLREVMAGGGSAEDRLHKIVHLIAAELHSEVCSIYALRAGFVLELFATVGLKSEAVRKTRLRLGEGLVGEIAFSRRPMAIADAPSHPSFAPRPETGEDAYRALAGVPVLRDGRVRGVLVMQSAEQRSYTQIEIETLETIAMVVAELFATGELVPAQELSEGSDPGPLQNRLEGFAINRGIAIGQAVLHHPRPTLRATLADDPAVERGRLATALVDMRRAIDRLLDQPGGNIDPAHRDILESYRMVAEDRAWVRRIEQAIDQGLTAEAAVQRVQNETRSRMASASEAPLRDLLLDLDDLANRLLSHLEGRPQALAVANLPDKVILVADALGPGELLDYADNLAGVVMQEGGATSHVAIVARALGVPVLGRCGKALERIDPLDPLILDADREQLFIRPAEDVLDSYRRALRDYAAERESYAELARLPAVTADGVEIAMQVNAALTVELVDIAESGADGIGLFRTEIPFMIRSAYPDVAAQRGLYEEAMDAAGGLPVTFRTLDVGGDKHLPFFPEIEEPNPAMGWRALRMGLDRPAMLRLQIRALLEAARGRALRILFPLVSEVAEFTAARQLVEKELGRLIRCGLPPPAPLELGAMLEVPALLWQLDLLCEEADFLSVGSNDLQQFLFAADRENSALSHRYDALAPALLLALHQIVQTAGRHGVPVTVCGEMAGRPLEAMALIGLGYRSLSMTAQSLGPVKAMLRSLDSAAIRDYLNQRLGSAAHSLRPGLKSFAVDHGVRIEHG